METSCCAKSTVGVITSVRRRKYLEIMNEIVRQNRFVFMTAPECGGFG
jgi:hypothetical protein